MEECAGVTVSLVGIRQDRAGVRAGAKGAEQLAELMGKGLEGIPLTQAGWAQYLIENLGGAVRAYDPNSYSK